MVNEENVPRLLSGLVVPPSGSLEATGDLMRARHRVSKLLLRLGIHYTGGATWTQDHMAWLYRQRFDSPALQMAYDLALEAVAETLERRDRLDKAITKIAYDSQYTPRGEGT